MKTIEHQNLLPQILDASGRALTEWIVRAHTEMQPELVNRLSGPGHMTLKDETRLRLAAMAECASVNAPRLFADQMAWNAAMYMGVGGPREDIVCNLRAMGTVLGEELPPGVGDIAAAMCRDALEAVEKVEPARVDNPLQGADEVARKYLLLLLEGRRDDAIELVVQSMQRMGSAPEVTKRIIVPVMNEVGRLWHAGEIGVGDEHFCTSATFAALTRINAMQKREPANDRKIIVSSVGGDLHELGVRVVADAFEYAGWNVRYLGVNTPAQAIVEAIEFYGADVLAVRATTIFHLRNTAELIRAVRSSGYQLPILVGGIPFTQMPTLAGNVGADGSALDAEGAVREAERLVATWRAS
jgi:MerR family transcriptional regulator, light-induced transcriptional regulator